MYSKLVRFNVSCMSFNHCSRPFVRLNTERSAIQSASGIYAWENTIITNCASFHWMKAVPSVSCLPYLLEPTDRVTNQCTYIEIAEHWVTDWIKLFSRNKFKYVKALFIWINTVFWIWHAQTQTWIIVYAVFDFKRHNHYCLTGGLWQTSHTPC